MGIVTGVLICDKHLTFRELCKLGLGCKVDVPEIPLGMVILCSACFEWMNRFYYSEIENLRSRLILLGERSTDAFKTAMRGLLNESIGECEAAILKDQDIDELDEAIELEAIRYISMRSPIAGELRMVMAAIKTAANLERIGDGARNIGRRSKRVLASGKIEVNPLAIEAMAVITLEMLEAAKDLMLQPDADGIRRVCEMDHEVDALHEGNLKGFVEQSRVLPEHAEALFELALISKVIERVADHVTNIARLMDQLSHHTCEYARVGN